MAKITVSLNFFINQKQIEIVNNFKYLGIIFNKSGKFTATIKENIDKARRAFYLLIRNCKEKLIPLDCQIELYNKCIEPILLYGCEVWGYEDSSQLETFRLKCFKIMLNLRASTPGYMLYGELGLLPLKCLIQKKDAILLGKTYH